MILSPAATVFRRLLRHCHDRQVWVGDVRHAAPIHRWTQCLSSLPPWKYVVAWINHRDTQTILARFPQVDVPFSSAGASHLISASLRAEWTSACMTQVARVQMRPPTAEPVRTGFSVLIPFFAHLRFFERCLMSVARAADGVPDIPLEVIVVNDDPAVADSVLTRAVPARLRHCTRILPNSAERGVCAALNRAVAASHYPWLVHLDCDDRVTGDCLAVLTRRIRNHPRVRYISSRMLDVDAEDRLLRVRLRGERPSQLISRGMVAGHLKAIRRDLFADIGLYEERYSGCQDYEFALRAGLVEPLLFIPDYLYAYRWHGRTQSVARSRRQTQTTQRIIDAYLLAARMLATGRPPAPLRFQGPMAPHWHDRYPWTANGRRPIAVEVHRPPSLLNETLFAIHVGRCFADSHWHGVAAPEIVF